MIELTEEQLAFLERHSIPLSRVFDASGMRTAAYQKEMSDSGLLVAVGVYPCNKSGHTMRVRGGQCMQCSPAAIAFLKRNDNPGLVYVATSTDTGLVKVGSSNFLDQRIDAINSYSYGGASDWEIYDSLQARHAGRVEFAAHKALRQYREVANYARGERVFDSREIFHCDPHTAYLAIKTALVLAN